MCICVYPETRIPSQTWNIVHNLEETYNSINTLLYRGFRKKGQNHLNITQPMEETI